MIIRRPAGVLALAALFAASAAFLISAVPRAQAPPRAPVVTEAVADFDARTLTVRGFEFAPDPPTATLGMTPLAVLGSVPDGFVLALPDVPPGTYLLALTWADGSGAAFQPTLGAAGPSGAAGPAGPRGLAGPPGASAALRPPPPVGVDADHASGRNTHFGLRALAGVTTGLDNAAFGQAALERLSSGARNAAFGRLSMRFMDVGRDNVAVGNQALLRATAASGNVAVGANALLSADGADNVALGRDALRANVAGSGNVAVGARAGIRNPDGSDNLYFGNVGRSGESGVIRIGTPGTHTKTVLVGEVEGVDTRPVYQ